MTTTTIEQFREQCAKVAEGNYTEVHEGDNAIIVATRYLCAKMIRGLPLPVIPEQAEPDEIQKFIDSLPDGHEDKMYEQIDAWARQSYMRHKYSVRGQIITRADGMDSHIIWATLRWAEENKKPDAALLARIAELEAENQKFTIDAQRYRHLRDSATLDTAIWEALEGFGLDTQEGYAKGMDDAIDRAILLAKSQK
jgi:hypothetical protein